LLKKKNFIPVPVFAVTAFLATIAITTGSPHGIMFRPDRTMLYSSDRWIIATDYDILLLRRPLDNLRKYRSDARTKSQTSSQGMENSQNEYEARIEESLKVIALRMNHIDEEIDSLSAVGDSLRCARGLLNFLGSGLHWLTGVATHDQINEIHEETDNLKAQNLAMAHSLKNKITYINQAAKTQSRQGQMLHQLSKAVFQLSMYMQITNSSHSEVDILHKLRNVETFFLLHLDPLQNQVNQYKQVASIPNGQPLTPLAVPPAKFSKTLQSISHYLPKGFSLLTSPTVKSIPFLYGTTYTTVQHTTKGFRLLTAVSHRQEGRMFHTYEVDTVTQQIIGTNKTVQILPDSLVLAVSEDQILLPHQYKQDCRGTSLLVCAPKYPIRGGNFPSCVIAAYRQQPDEMADLCNKRMIKGPYAQFIPNGNDGEFLYSVSDPIKFSLSCRPTSSDQDQQKAHWLEIAKQGLLRLPIGCSAIHPEHTLLSSSIFSEEQSELAPKEMIISAPTFTIPLTSEESRQLNQSTDIFSTLRAVQKLDTGDVPFFDSGKDLDILKPFSFLTRNAKTIALAAVISTSLTILAEGILILVI
jgi:hypothetical protein